MRLHHLTVTAFGPFAGTEQVGFDELCDAGLFLLTGPTGAGKTTVLDAVCFALYGSVPGVRGVKSLKSQHAPPDRAPEVVLEFSVRDRRFVVRRTPEWSRPKRRGEGFTTVHATATLVERTSGADHLLSSRAQEVGHFLGELIGMQAGQFVQVAMLPQGEFQKFLRASSQDRHGVLQHLFRTERYGRIEEWVHEQSRELRDRSAEGQQQVARILDMIAERAGTEVPGPLAPERLASAETRTEATAWASAHEESARSHLVAARADYGCALAALATARVAHAEARDLHAVADRREQAEKELRGLALAAADAEAARAALDRHTRAAGCGPLLRMLDDVAARHVEAAARWDDVAADLGASIRGAGGALELADSPVAERAPDLAVREVTREQLAGLADRARLEATRLEALLPRARQLDAAETAAREVESTLTRLAAEQEECAARAAGLPAALEQRRSQAAAARTRAGREEALRVELAHARARLSAAEEAERHSGWLTELEDTERDARDRAADARDLVQELTSRRLEGIAAELAGRLVDGKPCDVCGSTDHPAPARRTVRTVTQAEQEQAAATYDAAAAEHTRAAGEVVRARERLEGLRAAAGGVGSGRAAAEVAALEDDLAAAVRARSEAEQAEQDLDRLVREQAQASETLHALAVRVASARQALEAHHATISGLEAELAGLDRTTPIADQLDMLASLTVALERAQEALSGVTAAEASVRELRQRLDGEVREHGFTDLEAVRDAVLGDAERARLSDLLEARAQAEARARAVLDDDEVRRLGDRVLPDLEESQSTVLRLEAVEAEAARTLHQAEEAVASLSRLRTRLDTAFDSWRPVLDEYLRADAMARLVRGTSADNQLQMRLSAYVLATRLDQVVDAANERLAAMRDQRYLLQRTGRASRKGAQAGLGLEVVDQWTGDVRDPATLSGGETFVVSLALALGLADVVTQEAGGTEIETLFVDEGFGSLDADTLDDVMDRLDDLRAGGRAVGVVSHVTEMRNRIPTQLHVEKGRTGSVVTVRTAVA